METNSTLIQRALDAYNFKDMVAWLSTYAPMHLTPVS